MYMKSNRPIAVIDKSACIGCGRCISACPFGAIQMDDNKATVISEKCRGCMRCVPACPVNIIARG